MRGLILFAVLVGAVAGYRSPSYTGGLQQRPLKETVVSEPAPPSTLEPAASASIGTTTTATPSTMAPIIPPSGDAPIETKPDEPAGAITSQIVPLLPPDDNDMEPLSRRRLINYDQRQEGQYNIRADLENFMIVLIPPSPSSGLGLLDLLSKSALRRNSNSSKGQRKHYLGVGKPGSGKYQRQPLKAGGNAHPSLNYLSLQPSLLDVEIPRGHHVGALSQSGSSQRLPEFIEGRTPYHVDISASDNDQSRLHPDRQVDVLPPPYPLAYQHLIKPFHLEAEPSVIQTLPPSDIGSAHAATGSFLETYNQLLTADGEAGSHPSPKEGGFYRRASRAFHNTDFLNTNSIAALGATDKSTKLHPAWHLLLPLYLDELSAGAATLYPPIDSPKLADYLGGKGNVLRSFELETSGERDREQHLDDVKHLPPYVRAEDDVELTFGSGGGATFVGDSLARGLHSDGMERCAPGHRRDSYGLCREIDGY